MTVIVGIEEDGKVYLGADSIAVEGYAACSVTDPKVFMIGDIAIGFCGSFRVGQLLKYGLELPIHKKNVPDVQYLVLDFVDAMRSLFRDKGVLKRENDEDLFDGKLLMGYRGKLYYVDEDFQVCHVDSGYNAVGLAFETALGSLFSTEGMPPEDRLKIALEASAKWNAGVREPFNYLTTGEKPKQPRSRKSTDDSNKP